MEGALRVITAKEIGLELPLRRPGRTEIRSKSLEPADLILSRAFQGFLSIKQLKLSISFLKYYPLSYDFLQLRTLLINF